MPELDELRRQKDQIPPPPANWPQELAKWREKILAAHVQMMKAADKEGAGGAAVQGARVRVQEVWKEGGPVLQPLVLGRAIPPREAQLKYLIALCKHEEAELQQARGDRVKDPTKERAPAGVEDGRAGVGTA